MSIGVELLRRSRPHDLREAASGLERDRVIWMHVMSHVLAARIRAALWRGPAATAAAAVDDGILARSREACLALSATGTALVRAANRLDNARDLLIGAERIASDVGGWLDPDGRLVLPSRPPGADPIQHAVQGRADERARWEVTSLVARAVQAGTAVDRDLARSLLQAVTPNACIPGSPLGPVIPPPPLLRADGAARDEDVFASAAWWRVLSSEERRTVITEHPEWIGNRDGLPAGDRHSANLILLSRAEAELRSDPDAVAAQAVQGYSTGPGAVNIPVMLPGSIAGIGKLADLRAVRDVLRRGDPPRKLLLLDTSGEMVKAAVAIGDVDTAEHVATFVGGFTTSPRGDLRRHDAEMAQLKARTDQVAATSGMAGASTAAVVWMGYAAPQKHEVLDPGGRSVAFGKSAKVGAPALARFVNGIDASRDVPPHQVVDAHSYGSVLLAHTLRRNTGVDDVVMLGSPGVGTAFSTLAQAGLKPGALNVLVAEGDPVARWGWLRFGVSPLEVPGALALSTKWSIVPDLSIGTGAESTGHSNYFQPGSTSVENLAAVTLGRRDLLILDGERRRGRR